MRLIPYERLTVTTLLTPDEVLARLQRNLEPARRYRFFTQETKAFAGRIDDAGFCITPLLSGYRNSFNPTIEGRVVAEPDGCSITLLMYPNVLIIVLAALWLGANGLVIIESLIADMGWFGAPTPLVTSTWPQAAALFVGIYLLLIGFSMQVRSMRTYFCLLWDVYEVSKRV